MLTSCQVGHISEIEAQIAGIKRGYGVYIDPSNSSPYDLIYDVKGTLIRAQVKTVMKLRGASYKDASYVVLKFQAARKNAEKGKPAIPYHPTAFDFFLAVYQNDIWVIPIQDARLGNKVHLGKKFEKYRNAWHLIEEEAVKRSTALYTGYVDPLAEAVG